MMSSPSLSALLMRMIPHRSSQAPSGSVAENASASTVIYDADASDEDAGDSVTFSVSGTDQGLVEIDPENGEVTLRSSADYETKDTYSFNVIATDDGDLSDEQPVTVSVIDMDSPHLYRWLFWHYSES